MVPGRDWDRCAGLLAAYRAARGVPRVCPSLARGCHWCATGCRRCTRGCQRYARGRQWCAKGLPVVSQGSGVAEGCHWCARGCVWCAGGCQWCARGLPGVCESGPFIGAFPVCSILCCSCCGTFQVRQRSGCPSLHFCNLDVLLLRMLSGNGGCCASGMPPSPPYPLPSCRHDLCQASINSVSGMTSVRPVCCTRNPAPDIPAELLAGTRQWLPSFRCAHPPSAPRVPPAPVTPVLPAELLPVASPFSLLAPS